MLSIVLLLLSHSVMFNSFATPWIVDHQALLPVGYSREEYWSRLPFPSPGDLPNPGIKPVSLAHVPCIAGGFFTGEPPAQDQMLKFCDTTSTDSTEPLKNLNLCP